MPSARLRAALPTFVRLLEDPRVGAGWRRLQAAAARARRFGLGAAQVPAVAGALYVLALVAWGSSEPFVSDHERVLGDNLAKVTAWVHVRYAHDILGIKLELAAIALAFGAALGAAAGTCVRAALGLAGCRQPSRFRVAVSALPLTVLLHGGIAARSMAKDPQLYADAWYARGGALRSVQEAISDGLGPEGVVAIALALTTLWLAIAAWAARAARPVEARLPLFPPSRRRVAMAVAAAAVGVAGLSISFPGLHPRPAHRGGADRPNILVLAADSLRDDHVDAALTPNLAGVARQGTRFSRAYVSLARTFPSWATLLTGQYSHHHGIRSSFPRWEDRARPFDTVASRLARAGYATHLVSDYGGDVFRLADFGFEDIRAPRLDFREYVREKGLERARALLGVLHTRIGRTLVPTMRECPKCADADLLADDVVDVLRTADPRPFFTVVFFSAPHYPYASPAPYFHRFTDRAYEGPYKYLKPAWYTDVDPDSRDIAQIRGLYRGAVASVDDAAGRILRELAASGQREHTVVVIASDHGEDLFDDGRWHGHGDHLFGDAQNHIPLIVTDPRRPGGRVATDLVADVDLAPTLCELGGVPAPDGADGRSLAPALEGRAVGREHVFAETDVWLGEVKGFPSSLRVPYPSFVDYAEADHAHGDELVIRREFVDIATFAKHRMVFDGRYKLVYAPTPEGARWLFFDRLTDAGEAHDLSGDRPPRMEALSEVLWSWMLDDPRMERRNGYLAPRAVRIDVVDGKPIAPR